MNTGFYIANRAMPEFVQAAAQSTGAEYQLMADDWVIRLEKDGRLRWIVGYKFDVNSSAASEIAQDKAATYEVLHAAGIATVEHFLVRSVPHEPVHITRLGELLRGKPVVLKPLEGTGGRAVEYYDSVSVALDTAAHSPEPAWAIAPYYDFSAEYRMIILDGEVLLSLEKTKPTFRGKLKLFNLGHGAIAADITDQPLYAYLQATARQVMQAIGLRLAAVDIVQLSNGQYKVLEVNDGIMLEQYATQSDEYKNRAASVYDAIIHAMFA